MRQVCSQCRAVIIGFVAVVEVSRRTRRGPEQDRFLMCSECVERTLQGLGRRCVEPTPDTIPIRLREDKPGRAEL
jgi:hypothetical protein